MLRDDRDIMLCYIVIHYCLPFLFTTRSQGSGITFSEASVFNPAADGGAPT